MKATEILEWIVRCSIEGENLVLIDIPSVDDEYTPQNEAWWWNKVGGSPEEMVDAGTYLMYYPNDARDFIQLPTEEYTIKEYVPDATVRFDDDGSIVYLYKVED